ncbi:hypothetical protein [Flavobacterium sp. WG21]|uniref:hypothetical protein n=1 Tax=Flavobacterium sp. WG21 TaxID=1229487 RepID=UPI00034B1F34|nr:hypothetical protein [Flavobacterium sp. WG21]
MIEHIKYIINLVGGQSNALSILGVLVSLFFAFYLYFRTFYRLVFSSERICRKGREVINWRDENNEYTTRILFYNNGRKTLTSTDIKRLEINSTDDILSFKFLKQISGVKINSIDRNINIEIEYLDSSNFFVLEIEHKGYIDVEGRISETGKILQTEPRYWVIINFIFIFYLFYEIFVMVLNFDNPQSNSLINFFLIIAVFILIRFIHSILFIPDSISEKYLSAKDKFNTEFRNYF